MSINISKSNINAFLKRIPGIEEKRIQEIFGPSAYAKKSPGKPIRMTIRGKPVPYSRLEDKRIQNIFGPSAYAKKSPGKTVLMMIRGKPTSSSNKKSEIKKQIANINRQLRIWGIVNKKYIGLKNMQNIAKLLKQKKELMRNIQ